MSTYALSLLFPGMDEKQSFVSSSSESHFENAESKPSVYSLSSSPAVSLNSLATGELLQSNVSSKGGCAHGDNQVGSHTSSNAKTTPSCFEDEVTCRLKHLTEKPQSCITCPTITVERANFDCSKLTYGLSNSLSHNDCSKRTRICSQSSSYDDFTTVALMFDLVIKIDGRQYTTTRALKRFIELREMLVRESVSLGLGLKIPDFPPNPLSNPMAYVSAAQTFTGRGFSMFQAMLSGTDFSSSVEKWLEHVCTLTPTSPSVTNFLWEPVSEMNKIVCGMMWTIYENVDEEMSDDEC
mmetsp:Transcript_17745/g.35423  ORF Transcript_17745/g.35423 Transcript_17745/m.35423 type:complete len:296 (-) Transcript_17745:49-936(-)